MSEQIQSSKRLELLHSTLLPGTGLLRDGKRMEGVLLLSIFIFAFALAVVSRRKILALAASGNPDGIVAVSVLGALVLGLMAVGWRCANKKPQVRAGWKTAAESHSFFTRLRRSRRALAGGSLVVLLCLLALLAPLLAPFEPNTQADLLQESMQPPSWKHPLGTDGYARDLASRILYGARISLSIGIVAVLISVSLGALVGAFSGYLGGGIDSLFMRLVDMFLSFPRLVLLLAAAAFFQRSFFLIILILGLTGWMGISRMVRAQVLSLKEQEFIQAARAMGTGTFRIIAKHLIPNSLTPILVAATLGIGSTILLEASLSFLSLGVPPPTASWGSMVNEGRELSLLLQAPWISTFPGLAIVLAVVSFNLLGDGLQDVLDPRTAGDV